MSLLRVSMCNAQRLFAGSRNTFQVLPKGRDFKQLAYGYRQENRLRVRTFCSDGKTETEEVAEASDVETNSNNDDNSDEPLFVCKFTGEKIYSAEDVMRYQGTLTNREGEADLVSIPVFKRPLVNPEDHRGWLRERDSHSKLYGLTPIGFGKHLYNLQKEDPKTWTDAALAEKYHIPAAKVSAIIRIREHAEEWEKNNYVNPEMDLDNLAREVFGEFSPKEVREKSLEMMRRPPEGDSANYLILNADEPDFEAQRKKWEKEGRLSSRNPYGKKEEVNEESVSVGYDDHMKAEELEKKSGKNEYIIKEI